jgi:hypothetical protein
MTHEFEVRESIELDATPEQVWEAVSTGPGVDSWFMGRNEIEGRVGGRTRMTMGGLAQLGTVTAYEHFPGRTSTYNLVAPGPQVPDPGRVWTAFKDALGLAGEIGPGDPVRVSVQGLPPSEGVLEWADHGFMGARTGAGLYMLLHGHLGHVIVEYHDYTDEVDGERLESAWRTWLETTFA